MSFPILLLQILSAEALRLKLIHYDKWISAKAEGFESHAEITEISRGECIFQCKISGWCTGVEYENPTRMCRLSSAKIPKPKTHDENFITMILKNKLQARITEIPVGTSLIMSTSRPMIDCTPFIINTGNAHHFMYDSKCFVLEFSNPAGAVASPEFAHEQCTNKGGRLAWITNQTLFDFIKNEIIALGTYDLSSTYNQNILIGLFQNSSATEVNEGWYWRQDSGLGPNKSADDPSMIPPWYSNQPNDVAVNKDIEDSDEDFGTIDLLYDGIVDVLPVRISSFLCEYHMTQ